MKMPKHQQLSSGFTGVQWFFAILIIVIFTGVILVATDVPRYWQNKRDRERTQEVEAIADAIGGYRRDHGGKDLATIEALGQNQISMIVSGAKSTGCDDFNRYCSTLVSSDRHCVDLSSLVSDGYLTELPISPSEDHVWDRGARDEDHGTGYTLERQSSQALIVRACETERATEISVTR